jgi:molybdenum cofactor cytidylyltransferase
MADITGVLLAAGVSKRFGGHKLLAELNGQPLIAHSARSLSPCDRVIAVVRGDDNELHQFLRSAGIGMVINVEAEQGMGSSIATAVRASADSNGWCILPADMPDIPATVTRAIVEALLIGAHIAAPFYRRRRGHPVGFCKLFKDELLALTGDTGARTILDANPDQLIPLEVEGAGILRDIDTPRDYNRMV